MKAREQISSGQMSVLFFCFITGSSIINIPGPVNRLRQKRSMDFPVAVHVDRFGYSSLLTVSAQEISNMTFIEYSKAMVGNWITVLLAIPFISFQFHMTSGIVLDIGLFMTSSMMRQSPLYLFLLLVFCCCRPYGSVRNRNNGPDVHCSDCQRPSIRHHHTRIILSEL